MKKMQKSKEQLPSSIKYLGLPFYVFLKETICLKGYYMLFVSYKYKIINRYIADTFQFRISSLFRI